MIKGFFEKLFQHRFPTEQERVDAWLGESVSLIELESRIRMIDRNQAPWQTNRNTYGWM